MSELQAPYGASDASAPVPGIQTLVDKVTYCRAVQFDATDDSIDALRALTGIATLERCMDDTTPYVNLTALDCLDSRLLVGEWLVSSVDNTCFFVQALPLVHYSRSGALNFSQAVQLLLDGHSVRRTSFADSTYAVSLSETQPGQLIVKTTLGGFAYCLRPADLAATDWELFEGEEGGA